MCLPIEASKGPITVLPSSTSAFETKLSRLAQVSEIFSAGRALTSPVVEWRDAKNALVAARNLTTIKSWSDRGSPFFLASLAIAL